MIHHSLQIILRNKLKNGLLILQFALSFVALLLLIKEAYYNIDNMTMNIGFEPKGLIGGSISGLPGASTWKREWEHYLEGFTTIYVVKEPDQGVSRAPAAR